MQKILNLMMVLFFISSPALAGVPKPGDPAPGFTLQSMDEKTVTLSSFKGKVVLIGMFHICVPCMNQAMQLNKVREQIKSPDLVVLGINTSGDSKEEVANYLKGFPEPVSFPYLLDPGQAVHRAYIQRDMPTVLIVDKDGILKARSPAVGADQLVPFLKKLL